MRKPSQRSHTVRMFLQAAWAVARLASVVLVFSAVMALLSDVPADTRLSYWGKPVLFTKSEITSLSIDVKLSAELPESEDLLQAPKARLKRTIAGKNMRF